MPFFPVFGQYAKHFTPLVCPTLLSLTVFVYNDQNNIWWSKPHVINVWWFSKYYYNIPTNTISSIISLCDTNSYNFSTLISICGFSLDILYTITILDPPIANNFLDILSNCNLVWIESVG